MTLLETLRRDSADAHRQLEEEVDIRERIRDIAAYRTLLEQFLGFYGPLEMRIERVSGLKGWGYDPVERRKSPWLSLDLSTLGGKPADIVGLPLCEAGPYPTTVAEALGCSYVLEGATLGGRMISGWLEESAIPAGARHFFQSYGAEVGARWSAFCATLERFGSETVSHGEVIQAAQTTFAGLRRWLSMPVEKAA